MCAPWGEEAGYLVALGVPPVEILDADRRCPQCGKTPPPADECHVCGGPGMPANYWRRLLGRELPDDGQVVNALSMAAREVGKDEAGRLLRPELERLCRAGGLATEGDVAGLERLLQAFASGETSGDRIAFLERQKKAETAAKEKPRAR